MNVFRNQLLALASTPEVQFALFPSGVCLGDELVSDFDRNKQQFLDDHETTAPQRSALDALEAFILKLSGPHNAVFWCDPEPVTDDPRWEQIRQLARDALRSLDWEYSLPRKNGATYGFLDREVENVDDE